MATILIIAGLVLWVVAQHFKKLRDEAQELVQEVQRLEKDKIINIKIITGSDSNSESDVNIVIDPNAPSESNMKIIIDPNSPSESNMEIISDDAEVVNKNIKGD